MGCDQVNLPATDVSVYLQALYFRMADHRLFVPVSLIVPGSQIPFLKNGDRSKATLDVIGQVKDAEGHCCRQHPRHGYDPARDKAAPGG